MLLFLAHKLFNLFFCKSLIYDNQMTIHYQDVHLKGELTKPWHILPLLFLRLLSNQVNKDFEASSNKAIKLSISVAVAYGVFSSA